MDTITSRQHPLAKRCRALASGRTGPDDALLLDGAHLVGEALDAGWPIECAVVEVETGHGTPRSDEVATLVVALERARVSTIGAPARVFESIAPTKSPSGLLAVASPRAWLDDAFLTPAPPLVIVGVDIQDPGNVGAIVRAAEAAWATGVVFTGASADPFGWKALRGSMGSAFRLPVRRGGTANEAFASLAAAGLAIVAMSADAATTVDDADLSCPVAIVVGNEGRGVTAEILALCNARVSIPMRPPVDSLNVAVATAVVAFEARRQRQRQRRIGTP